MTRLIIALIVLVGCDYPPPAGPPRIEIDVSVARREIEYAIILRSMLTSCDVGSLVGHVSCVGPQRAECIGQLASPLAWSRCLRAIGRASCDQLLAWSAIPSCEGALDIEGAHQ